MSGTQADSAYRGFIDPESRSNEYAAMRFMVRQMLGEMSTATLVQVVSVTVKDAVGPVGYMTVRPLVAQVDGDGQTMPHNNITNLPYVRSQGGKNGVIIDPKPGDIGIAVFASRDISGVKKSKKAGPPGSFRRHDYSDGMYVGGALNETPEQYVRFTDDFVEIVSPKEIKLKAPKLTFDGDLTCTGSIQAGTGTGDSVTVQHHTHGAGPQPNPGT